MYIIFINPQPLSSIDFPVDLYHFYIPIKCITFIVFFVVSIAFTNTIKTDFTIQVSNGKVIYKNVLISTVLHIRFVIEMS
jgi:hypothetical protein